MLSIVMDVSAMLVASTTYEQKSPLRAIPVKKIASELTRSKLATPVKRPAFDRVHPEPRPGLLVSTGFAQVANFSTRIARKPQKENRGGGSYDNFEVL